MLFNDTIFYNIRYGRPDATDEEVVRGGAAGADRQLHQDAAAGLSYHGGRARLEAFRRREAARRHRAHHPQEAADPDARRSDERASTATRKRKSRTRSTAWRATGPRSSSRIGCRPSCMPISIIVLDKGRLVEQGSHAELIAKNGLYASLWDRQRQAEKAREELAAALEAGRACFATRRSGHAVAAERGSSRKERVLELEKKGRTDEQAAALVLPSSGFVVSVMLRTGGHAAHDGDKFPKSKSCPTAKHLLRDSAWPVSAFSSPKRFSAVAAGL